MPPASRTCKSETDLPVILVHVINYRFNKARSNQVLVALVLMHSVRKQTNDVRLQPKHRMLRDVSRRRSDVRQLAHFGELVAVLASDHVDAMKEICE